MDYPHEWPNRACEGTDPMLFHPEDGVGVELAQRICRRCENIDRCLEWALTHREPFGVWGGESERSRKRLRKERRLALAA